MGKVEELGMENSCSRFRIIHIDSEIMVKKRTRSKDLDTKKVNISFFFQHCTVFSLSLSFRSSVLRHGVQARIGSH